MNPKAPAASNVFSKRSRNKYSGYATSVPSGTGSRPSGVPRSLQPILVDRAPWLSISCSGARPSCARTGSLIMVGLLWVHPVNGEVPPVKGRPWKLPHYANRGKTSSSGGELASARSCFSTVRTALGKLRITGLLARFDAARSFPQFPRPLLLQPTIWTSERGADLGSGRCQPRPHLPIYRMTLIMSKNSGAQRSASWPGQQADGSRCLCPGLLNLPLTS